MTRPVGPPVEGWRAASPPSRTPMVGRWVTVSPFVAGSVDDLWATFATDDPAVWTYMGYGPFDSREEMAAGVASWPDSVDPLFWTFDVGGRARGWGAYLRIDPAMGSIEVGHLAFGPDLRRTRAATEAMYLMANRAFELGYRRYEWKCDALNAASRRAAARLGFTYEGTFRQHMVYKGRNRDTAWFSIIDAEWPRLRANLERWLDPSNFDERGTQRTPLSGSTISVRLG